MEVDDDTHNPQVEEIATTNSSSEISDAKGEEEKMLALSEASGPNGEEEALSSSKASGSTGEVLALSGASRFASEEASKKLSETKVELLGWMKIEADVGKKIKAVRAELKKLGWMEDAKKGPTKRPGDSIEEPKLKKNAKKSQLAGGSTEAIPTSATSPIAETLKEKRTLPRQELSNGKEVLTAWLQKSTFSWKDPKWSNFMSRPCFAEDVTDQKETVKVLQELSDKILKFHVLPTQQRMMAQASFGPLLEKTFESAHEFATAWLHNVKETTVSGEVSSPSEPLEVGGHKKMSFCKKTAFCGQSQASSSRTGF